MLNLFPLYYSFQNNELVLSTGGSPGKVFSLFSNTIKNSQIYPYVVSFGPLLITVILMDAQIAPCLAFGSLSHRPESLDLTSGALLFSGVTGCPSSTLCSLNSKPGTLAFLQGALGAVKEI